MATTRKRNCNSYRSGYVHTIVVARSFDSSGDYPDLSESSVRHRYPCINIRLPLTYILAFESYVLYVLDNVFDITADATVSWPHAFVQVFELQQYLFDSNGNIAEVKVTAINLRYITDRSRLLATCKKRSEKKVARHSYCSILVNVLRSYRKKIFMHRRKCFVFCKTRHGRITTAWDTHSCPNMWKKK